MKSAPKTMEPALSVDSSLMFSILQNCLDPVIGPVLDPTLLRSAHRSTITAVLQVRMKSSSDNHQRDRNCSIYIVLMQHRQLTLTPTTQRLICCVIHRDLNLSNGFRNLLAMHASFSSLN